MARTKQTKEEATKGRRATNAPAPRQELSKGKVLDPEPQPMEVDDTDGESDETSRGDLFCSNCGDVEGNMSWCTKDDCTRVTCGACVEVPAGEKSFFVCPGCFLLPPNAEERKSAKNDKYPWKMKGPLRSRRMLDTFSSDPLLIISIRLADLPAKGLPPGVVELVLEPYLPGRVNLIDVPYDFATAKSVKEYEERIRCIVAGLKSSNFGANPKIAVFVTTHSESERGDLHAMQGNQGANAPVTVLEHIMTAGLLQELRVRKTADHTLTILACGAPFTMEKVRTSLAKWFQKLPFSWIMGFTEKDLQPTKCSLFLADIAVNWFVHGRHPRLCLGDHQDLGAHTGIVIFSPGGSNMELCWSHPGRCPFGERVPAQCPCGVLRPYGTPRIVEYGSGPVEVTLRCRVCGIPGPTFKKPNDMELVVAAKRGDWYIRKF